MKIVIIANMPIRKLMKLNPAKIENLKAEAQKRKGGGIESLLKLDRPRTPEKPQAPNVLQIAYPNLGGAQTTSARVGTKVLWRKPEERPLRARASRQKPKK